MRNTRKSLLSLLAPLVLTFAIVLLPGISLSDTSSAEGGATTEKDPPAMALVKPGLDSLVRAEAAGNFNLADSTFAPGNSDRRILFRIRPSVTLTPSDSLTARVEGQWYGYRNDQDRSEFSLYQGYAEGILPGAKRFSLKAGRQEFVYGSTFLLGADTFYDGLSFDAAKLSFKPMEKVSLDMFGGRYVKRNSGGMEGTLYGIYGIYSPRETLSVDLYGFRDTGGAGVLHISGDHEVTWSVGTRISGNFGKEVAFELEPVYQFGRKAKDGSSHNDIRAYGGHADITLDPAIGRYPGKVFLSYAYGSGDGGPAEGRFTEFHNPDNDSSLIGDMNVISDLSGLSVAAPAGNEVRASGLHVVTAGGGIDMTEKVNVSLDAHYFRAVKTPAGIGKEIGVETNLIFTYKLKETISVLVSGNRFFTGAFFKDATGSGKDINYVYAQLQATF